jgi:hypothetical protein
MRERCFSLEGVGEGGGDALDLLYRRAAFVGSGTLSPRLRGREVSEIRD